MFYKSLIAVLYIFILICIPILGNAQSWDVVKSKNGNPAYYSKDGNGYYRKITKNEIAKRATPKTYIVADENGYYHNHNSKNGSYYARPKPQDIENYFKENNAIGYIVILRENNYIDQRPQHNIRDDADVAANYPLYFDD